MTGFLTSHFLKKKEKKKEANQRKGLVNKSFSGTNGFGKVTIESQFEIIELERTSEKSKVKVIDCHSNKSEYNSGDSKQELIKMVDGSWILSKEIEWIEKSKQEERDEKLNELLK
jgi:hypothetical protein